ncbi:MAG: peptidoglycan-binding protein [Spirulina sp. SIO3F2]|nr:peptidoglycan-binding protein [Spirulina sp. SIO3F2]
MESLSSLYYALTFEENEAPQQREISFTGFVRRTRLKMISLAWICLAVGLFTVSLENVALAIKQGDRGSEVTTLQETLKTEGYFHGPVTGYYGPITAEAVRRFQRTNQLDSDGIAGPKTQDKLYGPAEPQDDSRLSGTAQLPRRSSVPAIAPESSGLTLGQNKLLKRGQNSDTVRQLQLKLKQLGYFNGPTTGYYGTLTEAAVKRFQSAKNLAPDGVVGPKTLAIIEGREIEPDNTPFQMDDFTAGDSSGSNSPFADWESATQNAPRIDWEQSDFGSSDPTLGSPENSSSPSRLSQQTQVLVETAHRLARPPRPEASPRSPDSPQLRSAAPPSETPSTAQPRLSLSDYTAEFTEAARTVTERMALKTTIYGNIAPKSIVHSGKGLFFAQNMMYTHSITVYDRNYQLVKTISDAIELQKYGYPQYAGKYRGAPVEASFSHDGQYAWVSNYQMYGAGFNRPGNDKCNPGQKTDPSFLYRVNTQNFEIDQVVKVGSVPKYVAATPDDRYVLVTNWCTDDLSVVDVARNREVRRIKLGRYPRGIVIDGTSNQAYVAVMGSQNIAKISLDKFKVDWFKNVGRSPRHLSIDPQGRYLYTSLNGEGRVAKIDLKTGKTVAKVVTGNAPRSMVLSQDGEHIYVVNYESDTMAKVRTTDMRVVHTVSVNDKPIGITYDPAKKEVWVSCYSGSIMVFEG